MMPPCAAPITPTETIFLPVSMGEYAGADELSRQRPGGHGAARPRWGQWPRQAAGRGRSARPIPGRRRRRIRRARRPVSSARVLVPEPLRCRSVRPRRPLSGGLSECAHRCTPFRRQPAGAPLALHDCRELHPQLFPEAASSPARVRRTEANVGRPGATGTTPDGERSAVASQTLAWLERQIPQLPLRQREVLLLACVERRPQQEIAQILGMPLNTIKTHLRRARLSLAHKLAQARAEGSERHS